MLKLELIILPLLAFLGPSNITNASTKTPIPSSQLSDAKTGVNYEFITIAANYVNGMWLVDGRQRPVIKTSMTKRNYLQIENDSASTPLNLVIPKIEFSIIAKNGVFISKFISLDEDASGKRILWLEPGSSMTISFVNDLSSTPLQALVSVTKQKKEVIAIFGPDQGKNSPCPYRQIHNNRQSTMSPLQKSHYVSMPPKNFNPLSQSRRTLVHLYYLHIPTRSERQKK